MAKRSIEESTLIAIADAIREKGGTTAGLDPEGEMPQAILDIKGAEIAERDNPSGGKTVYINSEAPEEAEEAMLPEGFTRLKWIQSDGRQYADTGVYPDQDTKVSLKVSCENGDFYCRVGQSTGSQRFGLYAVRDTSRIDFLFGGVGYVSSAISGLSFPAEISLENGLLTANQKTYEFSPQGDFSLNRPLPLFAEDVNGSITKGNGRLYEGRIYGSGTLVRNYIPCLNSSGEAGLWDTVTQAFFGDAAGVGFIAGPVVLDYTLPEGYEELAWIQSDGRQYADTGVLLDSTSIPRLRVVADIELVITSGKWCVTGSGDNFPIVHFGINPSGKITYGNGSLDVVTTTTYTQARYTWDYDLLNKRLSVGTTNITGITVNASGTGGKNFYISAYSNNTSAVKHEEIIFGYQIYDNGTLVRYYVPCRTNTGEVGLWDAVNSVFYGDAAGVGFIAGPVVGNSVSKVVLEDEVLIDLTGDTISPETVLAGFIGHDKTGAQFVGELVQKAGGRPVATGEIISSSTTHSVTGLEFAPKIVFVIKTNSTPPTDRTSSYFALYYNAETGDRFSYTCSLGYTYGTTLGSISGNVITLSGNGFSISSSVKFYDLYRWVAIGAEA